MITLVSIVLSKLKLSPSMVVAMLALFVALTGTSVAVVSSLPAKSVGVAQLKANAVNSNKVKNGSLLAVDFAPGQAEISSVSGIEDIRVSNLSSNPQVLLSLPATYYDGSPVAFHLSIDYANFIPDGTISCGISFSLFDGARKLSAIGLFGAHYTTQGRFSPIELFDVLEGARTPAAGTHTFSIRVSKWSPTEDDYLRAGNGLDGNPKPMRFSARYN